MIKKASTRTGKRKPITASDLGRYIKSLAALHKDTHLGNPYLYEALMELSGVLIEAKSNSPQLGGQKFVDFFHNENEDYEEVSFEDLGSDQIRSILEDDSITKSQLIIIALERFSIPRSRLEKISRDEIIKLINAALGHEESLDLISEQAIKGGADRSS